MRKYIYHLLLIVFCFLLHGFSEARAASLIIDGPSVVSANQDFTADVMIDAAGENLNAFEETVIFPANLLKIKEIREGGSIVNFWIEKPKEDGNGIKFSGITPGGFRGVLGTYAGEKPGKLFSIIFSAVKAGNGAITAGDVRILLEDGKGTPAETSVLPLRFSVEESGTASDSAQLRDINPPETFRPEIANNPAIFDNRHFLAFTATDKESGIDHYEILEVKSKQEMGNNAGNWIIAESPYLLKNQRLSDFIFVKAVDKAGNKRTEELQPLHPKKTWYENGTFWVIIVVVFGILNIVLSWKRKSKK